MRGEQVTFTVAHVTRRRRSANGNPTMVLHSTTGQQYVTAMDAMCAFAISDHWRDVPVTVTLDPTGRVVDVEATRS